MCRDLKHWCVNVILLMFSVLLFSMTCTNQVILYRANIPFNDVSFILGFTMIGFSVVILFFEIVQYLKLRRERRQYEVFEVEDAVVMET